MSSASKKPTWPADVQTLAIDIGGTGLKASVLDAQGQMTADKVRMDTPYPCPPATLVSSLTSLVEPLPKAHRVSVGFPGLVRQGTVIEVPSLSRREYGGPRDPEFAAAWSGFDLESALAQAFGLPTKVLNDADVQGCAVIEGNGLEFVMTLGTGVGTALFNEGVLLPHMELSHGPFKDGLTFDLALGEAARKDIGNARWTKRVRKAIRAFDDMLYFRKIYIGGGNAKRLSADDIGTKGQVVSNTAGILGGIRVWDLDA